MTDINKVKPVKVPKPAPAPKSDMDKLFDLATSGCNTEVFQRLTGLITQDQYAKKAQSWHDAMRACQSEMGAVSKDASNGATGGSKYATLGAVDAALRPIYIKHGFDVTFDTEAVDGDADALGVILTISHEGGHRQTFTIAMPCDGKGAQGKQMMTLTHAAGSATTYGRRYLLCLAFNIATVDDDGNAATSKAAPRAEVPAHEKVTAEQATNLIALADESGANKRLLCVFLSKKWGVEIKGIADIPRTRFDDVLDQLKMKKQANAN